MTSYHELSPITEPIPAERQGAKRHYGVHPYFTRRPYNVVRSYILNFTQPGDTVLDPYGGSGVTAIEAFLENRIGLHNDINPLANFIAKGIAGLAVGQASDYQRALQAIEEACANRIPEIEHMSEAAVARLMKQVPLPANVLLPSNSDAPRLHDIFFPRQLAGLAAIKAAIDNVPSKPARNALLLAFSATLAKVNKTFLSAEGRAASRGGSSIFSIYRYKVAKNPVTLPLWPTFHERATNVLAAKAEIDNIVEAKRRTSGWTGQFHAYSYDILNLPRRLPNKVDYIFTDPPYGAHISYLDLSTLWNAWLGDLPTKRTRQREIIVGGELDHSEEAYIERLAESIRACIRMLKRDRWLSVVFQHWNTAYFRSILKAAAELGADLRTAVSQTGDPIWSMHKKKGNESILAGELILTFLNTGKRIEYDTTKPYDLEHSTFRILQHHGMRPIHGEYLLNRLIIDAWHQGAIDSLTVSKDTFRDLLRAPNKMISYAGSASRSRRTRV